MPIVVHLCIFTTLSPINPMVEWKMVFYLKGNDPIEDTPIVHWLPMDYGRNM